MELRLLSRILENDRILVYIQYLVLPFFPVFFLPVVVGDDIGLLILDNGPVSTVDGGLCASLWPLLRLLYFQYVLKLALLSNLLTTFAYKRLPFG